jgi:hypothetical protein
MLLRTVK